MNLTALIAILIAHWVADFILQTNEDAQNKWNSPAHLLHHIACYSAGLFLLVVTGFFHGIGSVQVIFGWWLINTGMHWITDYFTSKWTHDLWEKKDVHGFFVVIGLDQLIHYLTLFGTYVLLIK